MPDPSDGRAKLVRAEGTAAVVAGSAGRWFAPGFGDREPEVADQLLGALRATDDESYARACEALATFDKIQGFGVHWIRSVLYWQSVAPDPASATAPAFDDTDPGAYPGFGRYDRAISEARARGLRVLLTVSGPVPRWATRDHTERMLRAMGARLEIDGEIRLAPGPVRAIDQ